MHLTILVYGTTFSAIVANSPGRANDDHFADASLFNPRTSRSMGTWKTSQMRSSVVTVMGRPASICCQCRAENPKEIMSSWL